MAATAELMGEEELLQAVLDLARLLGWRAAHFRPAKTAHGWRTAVQGDGKGFPDLVMVHPGGRFLVVELKADKGRLSADQLEWLNALNAALGPAVVQVWRPSHWADGTIERELRDR